MSTILSYLQPLYAKTAKTNFSLCQSHVALQIMFQRGRDHGGDEFAGKVEPDKQNNYEKY